MSRSVWTHSYAIETVFFPFETCYENDDCEWDWREVLEDVRETLKAEFPSFEDADSWPESESHCILENGLAQIVISEYCGLVSLGIVPRERCTNIATTWCAENAAPFVRKTWGKLRKIGTFSNGEAIFERVPS